MRRHTEKTAESESASVIGYKISFENKIFAVKRGKEKAFVTISFPHVLSVDGALITKDACERIESFYKSLCEEYKTALSQPLKNDDGARRTLYIRVSLNARREKRNTLSFERRVSASVGGIKLCESCYRDSFRLSSGMLCG